MTGKIIDIMTVNDLNMRYELQDYEVVFAWLVQNSHEVFENSDINTQRVINTLINNFNMKNRSAQKLLNEYKRPILVYNVHHYQKRWVRDWMIVLRTPKIDDVHNAEEMFRELEESIREMGS
jgi:hypothetical protein